MSTETRDWPLIRLSKEEAAEALRGAAFTNGEDGRTTVHSFLGSVGADHDLDGALALVEKSDDRAWVTHMIHHDLTIRVDGKQYQYDVQRPERSARPDTNHHSGIKPGEAEKALREALRVWEQAQCDCCSPTPLDEALDGMRSEADRIRSFGIEVAHAGHWMADENEGVPAPEEPEPPHVRGEN